MARKRKKKEKEEEGIICNNQDTQARSEIELDLN